MKYICLSSKLVLFFLVSGLLTTAHAQSVDENTPIDEIVVQATRTQLPETAIPGTVTLIDTELLSQQAQISDELASVLSRSVPGFAPGSQKLAGRGETLRGRNPLYLVDGVPQHNALRDGQRDGHSIDLAFIERIEVINGSNAIQGVGATGGVVNSITVSAPKDSGWQTTMSGRFSSSDDFDSDSFGYKLSALVGYGGDEFSMIGGVAFNDRGLFFDADGNPVGMYPTQGDIMDSETLSLYGKARWQVSDQSSLTLLLSDFDLERNGDFRAVLGDRDAGIPTGTEEGSPAALVGDPARNENTLASLTYVHENLWGGNLEVQAYDQSFSGLYEGGTFGGFFRLTVDGPEFLDQSAIESDKNGVKITYNKGLESVGLHLTGGVDFFRDDSAQVLARSNREWVPETRFETLSPFAQVNWQVLDWLTISGGARYEDAKLEVDDYTTIAAANSTFVAGGEPKFDELLGNIGIIFQFTDGLSLYAAFNEGFTMPDVGRVLRGVNVPGQDVDNLLTVEPIVTDNTEIGIEFEVDRFSARLAYFESEADNGSRLLLNDVGIFEVQRQRTEIDGFEASINFAVSDQFNIGANYSNTDARFDSDNDGSVDSDLDGLNIGPDRISIFADGRVFDDKVSWRVQVSDFQSRDFVGLATRPGRNFESHTQVDAFVGWATNAGTFSLAVENLLNEDYFTYFAQTEPAARQDTYFKGNGRTLTFGWKKQF